MEVAIHQCYPKAKFIPIAFLIKCLQGTNYSHYAISYESHTGHLKFLDSTSMSVRSRLAEYFAKDYMILKTYGVVLDCTPSQFYEWIESYEGKDYSVRQVFGLLLKLVGFISKNPWGKGASRIICNELIILLLRDFKGVPVRDTDDYDLNETEVLLEAIR